MNKQEYDPDSWLIPRGEILANLQTVINLSKPIPQDETLPKKLANKKARTKKKNNEIEHNFLFLMILFILN